MPGLDQPQNFPEWMRWVEKRLRHHDWRINGVGARAGGGVTPTCPDIDWLPLSLVNGWVDFGSGFDTAAVSRRNGIVYLRGLIKSGTVGATIATLPVGMRPHGKDLFVLYANTTGAASAGTAHVHSPGTNRIDVDAAGVVTFVTGVNTLVDLSQIIFPAEGCFPGTPAPPSNGLVVEPSWKRVGNFQQPADGAFSASVQNVGTIAIPEAHWVPGRIFRCWWNGQIAGNTAGNYSEVFLRYGSGASLGSPTAQFAGGLVDHRVANRRESITVMGELPPWPLPSAVSGTPYNVVAVVSPSAGSSRWAAQPEYPTQMSLDAYY